MTNNENGQSVATIPQYEMFPSLFDGGAPERAGISVKVGEHGTSVVVLKRTGKTESLSAVTGLKGDALKAREREIRDWAKRQAAPVIAAVLASPNFTFGSMRYGKNGSFSLRMPKVEAPKAPVITPDSILDKFTSEELMELADRKCALEQQADAQAEAVEVGAQAPVEAPAAA
ncbi:MAG TPA: hypothetical protein VMQ76_04275 [Terracidiphilus sp.]|nr:hypothetical protein [Terracidiphilus sp.]